VSKSGLQRSSTTRSIAGATWRSQPIGPGTTSPPCWTAAEYSGRYYAALVLDPDGNNVEAVFHGPAPAQ